MYYTSVNFLEYLVLEATLHFNLSKYFFFAKAIKSLKMTSRSWAFAVLWGREKECINLQLHLLNSGSGSSGLLAKQRQQYLLLSIQSWNDRTNQSYHEHLYCRNYFSEFISYLIWGLSSTALLVMLKMVVHSTNFSGGTVVVADCWSQDSDRRQK